MKTKNNNDVCDIYNFFCFIKIKKHNINPIIENEIFEEDTGEKLINGSKKIENGKILLIFCILIYWLSESLPNISFT